MNALLATIAAKLFELMWPKIEALFLEKVLPVLVEKLSALLPLIVAAATKAVADEVFAKLPHLDVADLPSLPDLTETVREAVNQIPEINIPGLGDLSEWMKGI